MPGPFDDHFGDIFMQNDQRVGSGVRQTGGTSGGTVGGNMYVTDPSQLKSGTIIGSNLYINDCQFTTVPTGVIVGGNVYVANSNIASPPNGWVVGGVFMYS